VTARFGPDGALYLVDYGAVRDFGRADPDAMFKNPDDAPLVVIPQTGVIWKISLTNNNHGHVVTMTTTTTARARTKTTRARGTTRSRAHGRP
jgi:hypothetical protein